MTVIQMYWGSVSAMGHAVMRHRKKASLSLVPIRPCSTLVFQIKNISLLLRLKDWSYWLSSKRDRIPSLFVEMSTLTLLRQIIIAARQRVRALGAQATISNASGWLRSKMKVESARIVELVSIMWYLTYLLLISVPTLTHRLQWNAWGRYFGQETYSPSTEGLISTRDRVKTQCWAQQKTGLSWTPFSLVIPSTSISSTSRWSVSMS